MYIYIYIYIYTVYIRGTAGRANPGRQRADQTAAGSQGGGNLRLIAKPMLIVTIIYKS